MAKLLKTDDALLESYKKYKKNRNWCYVVSVGCFLLWLYTIIYTDIAFKKVTPYFLFVLLVCGLLGKYFSKKTNILHSGLEGEDVAAGVVSKLPNSYYCFRNLNVSYKGQTSEMDMVVVGPTGVFVLETKNLNGTILGDFENKHWIQRKIGRDGTLYSKKFYSPVKQVGTQVYRLAHFLRSNGVRVHVKSIVYFSNPDAAVRLTGKTSDTMVFSTLKNGDQEMRKYILECQPQLAGTEVQKIKTLLVGK